MVELPAPRFIQQEEYDLYDLLIDDTLSDPWAIEDLLEAHGLASHPVFLDHLSILTEALERAIADINSVVKDNPQVFSPYLVRPPKYPRIRQMRDVHQFDVGSHLAYCHALACRDAVPSLLLKRYDMVHLEAHLTAARNLEYRAELSAAAIFHDLYKSLRPRRRLPDKGTDVRVVEWRLPDGSSNLDHDASDENCVGSSAIALYWPRDTTRMSAAIELSGWIGKRVYREAKAENTGLDSGNVGKDLLSIAVIPENTLGLELAIIDWLGKGWAADLIAVRKKAQCSHSHSMIAFLGKLETALAV